MPSEVDASLCSPLALVPLSLARTLASNVCITYTTKAFVCLLHLIRNPSHSCCLLFSRSKVDFTTQEETQNAWKKGYFDSDLSSESWAIDNGLASPVTTEAETASDSEAQTLYPTAIAVKKEESPAIIDSQDPLNQLNTAQFESHVARRGINEPMHDYQTLNQPGESCF